jgi:hypothetical protein
MNNAIGDLNYKITGKKIEFSEVNLENQNGFEGGANDLILDEVEEEFENNDKNIIKFIN